jgi:hypothetical protein
VKAALSQARPILELLRQWLLLLAQMVWLLAELIGKSQVWP